MLAECTRAFLFVRQCPSHDPQWCDPQVRLAFHKVQCDSLALLANQYAAARGCLKQNVSESVVSQQKVSNTWAQRCVVPEAMKKGSSENVWIPVDKGGSGATDEPRAGQRGKVVKEGGLLAAGGPRGNRFKNPRIEEGRKTPSVCEDPLEVTPGSWEIRCTKASSGSALSESRIETWSGLSWDLGCG